VQSGIELGKPGQAPEDKLYLRGQYGQKLEIGYKRVLKSIFIFLNSPSENRFLIQKTGFDFCLAVSARPFSACFDV